MSNKRLDTALPLLFGAWLKDVHCIIIGRIETYDKTTRKATVTPLLNRSFPNREVITYKPIQNVPCAFIGGANLHIDIEYAEGDNVVCGVSDYSINNYITSDGESRAKTNQTSHEMQDMIVLMGIAPENKDTSENKVEIGSEGNFKISNPNGYITLQKDGTVDLNGNLEVSP